MSFIPALPATGFAGWALLKRTKAAQEAAFAAQPAQRRDAEHFAARAPALRGVDDLMGDRRLLGVVLGAYGLEADLPNRFFIRRVLSENPADPAALVNRLADKRYRALAEGAGFGAGNPARRPGFAERILGMWQGRSFEVAVGRQDDALRLALNAERELATLAVTGSRDDARWFAVMGNPPLRKVFETAFGLPVAFGRLDIDRQLSTLRQKAEAAFGDPSLGQFQSREKREALIQRFLLRAEASGGAGGTVAAAMARVSTLLAPLAAPRG
jgi:hypothetical protein